MKRKQVLNISGMEISVVTDADPAIIEQSVGMVDRTIREIKLKSAGCSLTEAAVLCALDANAERLTLQQNYKKNADQVAADKEIIEDLRHRLDAMTTDLNNLKADNKVMHEILSKATVDAAQSTESPVPAANEKEVADKAAEAGKVVPSETTSDTAVHHPPKGKTKNHVGSMFDLLTFDDV